MAKTNIQSNNFSSLAILINKYGDSFVPLATVASDYYGINDRKTLLKMVYAGEFKILKPFKARDSIKSPWLVSIENLAFGLDHKLRITYNSSNDSKY
jgi:hypothetical protein